MKAFSLSFQTPGSDPERLRSGEDSMMNQTTTMSQGMGSPLSDDAYNVITALHAQLEGLEAYRKFAQNGSTELWQELTQQELPTIERLASELERMVQQGQFRMRASGQAA